LFFSISAPPQIGQLKISLVSVLDQWTLYKLSSEEMNGYLMEGRYSVSRFRLLTGSLEAVQLQVESLQVILGRTCISGF
jgi:nesprin-1